ncbi:hypothetical protein BDN72DRAFT_285765 [Pluteus cervinus]|uniref:Uncharacterized protein n=1 Tax=Pluteus cervinus TaxID=181527 RepID=A0ACD3AEL4_9AGAR|nr:hypothetical protein BDN72DRAFT_285765 [Pluteus cervinus]
MSMIIAGPTNLSCRPYCSEFGMAVVRKASIMGLTIGFLTLSVYLRNRIIFLVNDYDYP